jgi:hypothetical protein
MSWITKFVSAAAADKAAALKHAEKRTKPMSPALKSAAKVRKNLTSNSLSPLHSQNVIAQMK